MRSLLFHGTRYPTAVLKSGVLRYSRVGSPTVCFSRSIETARYWASMERDNGEQLGAVLVLDRDRLNARYRLHQFDYWGDRSEAEERIYRRDVDQLGRYLVGVFFGQNSLVADRPDVLDRSEAIAVRAICKRERMGELTGAEQIDEAYNQIGRDDDGEWFASRPGRRLCLQSYYPGEHGLGSPTKRGGAVLVTGVVDHGPNGRERLGLYQARALHVPDTDRAIGFSFPKSAAALARGPA